MTLKDCIIKTHNAIVDKAMGNINAGDSAQTFADIGTDICEYGQTWPKSIANDGKIDETEAANIKTVFDEKISKRVPDIKGLAVSIVWNGVTLFGFGWKGVRFYVNEWLGLDIKD